MLAAVDADVCIGLGAVQEKQLSRLRRLPARMIVLIMDKFRRSAAGSGGRLFSYAGFGFAGRQLVVNSKRMV